MKPQSGTCSGKHTQHAVIAKKKEQLIEYDSVAEFYEARLKGGGSGGQEKIEKVHTEQSET